MDRLEYDHTKLEGTDADIEISLKEYGLAWIETDTDYLFYYGVSVAENECGDMDYIKFDFCSFNKDMDIKQEFDWVDFTGVNDWVGGNLLALPLEGQISSLLSCYSYENVFGSSHWEGLTYTDIVKG